MTEISILNIHKNIEKIIGSVVVIKGWIRNIRFHAKKEFVFLDISDGSTVKSIQAVIDSNINYYNELFQEPIGTGIIVKGEVQQSKGNSQIIDLVVSYSINKEFYFSLFGKCETSTYKLLKAKDKINYDKLKSIPHLRPRTKFCSCIARIRSKVSFYIHEYFQNTNAILVNTPIITSNNYNDLTYNNHSQFQVTTFLKTIDTDSDKIDVFNSLIEENIDILNYIRKYEFFRQFTYLNTSHISHLIPYSLSLSDVYSFGPVFRVESKFVRDLCEFWLLEAQFAFSDLNDAMIFTESLIKDIISKLVNEMFYDLDYFVHNYDSNLLSKLAIFLNSDYKIHRIDYSDAILILKEAQLSKKNKLFKANVSYGIKFDQEHEAYLCNYYDGVPLIILNFPQQNSKPYYKTYINDKNEEYILYSSFIFPQIGEIAKCYTINLSYNPFLTENNENIIQYNWFNDIIKFGQCPISGLSLGFDRLIMYLTGISNICEVVPYPRSKDLIDC